MSSLSVGFKHSYFLILCLFIVHVAASTPNSRLPFSFGNGFVDLAALTSVIGSSTAESLVLGDRGFGGLAWAATSAFGTLFVIKACITGASPSWLRVTLDIRNATSDGALGVALRLEKGRTNDERARRNLGEACGIIIQNETVRGPILLQIIVIIPCAEEVCHIVRSFHRVHYHLQRHPRFRPINDGFDANDSCQQTRRFSNGIHIC